MFVFVFLVLFYFVFYLCSSWLCAARSLNAPVIRSSFNAAIDACGRAGQPKAAVSVLDTMRAASRQNSRVKPDSFSYAGALHACRLASDATTASELLQVMKRDRIKMDQRCALAAFSASCSAGNEDEAAEILEEMLRNKVATSEGALVGAKESLVEMVEGGGGGGRKFARALVLLDELETARVEMVAAKAARATVAAEEEAAAAGGAAEKE